MRQASQKYTSLNVLTWCRQKTVCGVISGERGKSHTLLACGSTSGHIVPPLTIFPRDWVPEALKVGAPLGTWCGITERMNKPGDLFLLATIFYNRCPSASPRRHRKMMYTLSVFHHTVPTFLDVSAWKVTLEKHANSLWHKVLVGLSLLVIWSLVSPKLGFTHWTQDE